jgi:hypothetical protein
MKTVTLLTGSIGVDTIQTLSRPMCDALRRENVRFVVRYLGGLTPIELSTILDSGLACSFVTYAGAYDGPSAAKHLGDLAVPVGAVVWLDVEDVKMDVPSLIAQIAAWAHTMKDHGYVPGIYVGAGCPLTSQELYALPVVRYWHSCSRVVDRDGREAAPSCGWCMRQLSPPNMTLAGVKVDIDVVELDYQGRGVAVVID